MSTTTRLFLHGSGMGAWVWERVLPLVEGSNLALDLPSLDRDLTPQASAKNIVSDLDRRGVTNVHIVLHSLSGILAPDLGQALGSRLHGLTFVAGVVPEPGQSFAEAQGFPVSLILPVLFAFNHEGIKPSDDVLRKAYGNDLSEGDQQMIIDRCLRDRPAMDLTKITAAVPDVPTVYVRTTLDHSLTPSHQDKMIGRLRAPRVIDIDAGHLVMLSQPQALAKAVAAMELV